MSIQLTTSEKIKIALGRTDTTMKDLAEKLGTTRQNLHNKMVRDNFNESDLQKIAEALGMKLEIHLVMEDGTKI